MYFVGNVHEDMKIMGEGAMHLGFTAKFVQKLPKFWREVHYYPIREVFFVNLCDKDLPDSILMNLHHG